MHQYHADGCGLVDGYAPFCKHVFVPNFVGAQVGALAIKEQNRHLLRSAYVKRRPEELAVLARCARQSPDSDVLYSDNQLLRHPGARPTALDFKFFNQNPTAMLVGCPAQSSYSEEL